MKQFLVIDGYNVLHALAESQGMFQLNREELDHEREKLIERCCNYAALTGFETVLVFDAWTREERLCEEAYKGILVVYTNKDQTADAYIERYLYKLPRLNRKIAVTSDAAIQKMALLVGAERMSSKEFVRLLDETERGTRNVRTKNDHHRNALMSQVSSENLLLLERLRLGEVEDWTESSTENNKTSKKKKTLPSVSKNSKKHAKSAVSKGKKKRIQKRKKKN